MRHRFVPLLAAFLGVFFLVGSASAVPAGVSPILISQPDFSDEHTGNVLSDNGDYFLTSDGYPVVRDVAGNWIYVLNGTSLVAFPVGDGMMWMPASGPAVFCAPVLLPESNEKNNGGIELIPSVTGYSLPNKR